MCGRKRRVDVTELMDAPEGTVRVGDEFHNPDNWQDCPRCRAECPAESTTCFNCGADLGEPDAGDA